MRPEKTVLSCVFMTCFAFTFNYIKNMFPGYTAWRDLQTYLENTWITGLHMKHRPPAALHGVLAAEDIQEHKKAAFRPPVNFRKVVYVNLEALRRDIPTRASMPEPNNQAAAGTGISPGGKRS